MKRYAIVRNADTRKQLEAYLPDNYRVIAEFHPGQPAPWVGDMAVGQNLVLVIQGEDNAGWTLDDYVIPRLYSGMIYATEIDLSHPIMKQVPA